MDSWPLSIRSFPRVLFQRLNILPSDSDAMTTAPAISRRGQEILLALGPIDPLKEGYYDEKTNPTGLVNLTTAENSLMSQEVLKYMHEHFELTENHLKYRAALTLGQDPSTKTALPRFLNRTLRPRIPITPSHTVIGPGIGAILAQLIWHLCDEGDGVLITAPYYADYPRDIVYPAKAIPISVPVPADVDSLSPKVLPYIRKTILEYQKSGKVLRALILNNPHNPIACAYDVETIKGYADIAEEFDLHLIVDEVFANEVFASSYTPHPVPFVSILSIDFKGLVNPARIHVLAGPTKDFGASGIKVGSMVSYNDILLRLITNALSAIPISSAADALFTKILNDEQYCDWFLEENRRRLGNAFDLLGHWCDFHHIPFLPAQAGVFGLVDFERLVSPLNGATTTEKIAAFIDQARQGGVRLRTPADHEDPVKTRFRIVFTLPEKIMKLAFHRLESQFGLPHWQDIDTKEK